MPLASHLVFPKWSRTFAEFSEFRESDKSLKHELGSIERFEFSHVSCWHYGSILAGLSHSTVVTIVTEFTDFSENIQEKAPICVMISFRRIRQNIAQRFLSSQLLDSVFTEHSSLPLGLSYFKQCNCRFH